MELQSRRRQQVQEDLGLVDVTLQKQAENAIAQEEARRVKKEEKRLEIQQSSSYQLIRGISTAMDKWFLDPIIGFFPIVGDLIGSVFSLPFIYVSLFKVRSIPLTLAVIRNTLVDVLLGLIPFWIGSIVDIFYRSNLKNFKLITGFVDDDKEVISEVNRKAIWMTLIIAIICYLIYWVIVVVSQLTTQVLDWISSHI